MWHVETAAKRTAILRVLLKVNLTSLVGRDGFTGVVIPLRILRVFTAPKPYQTLWGELLHFSKHSS